MKDCKVLYLLATSFALIVEKSIGSLTTREYPGAIWSFNGMAKNCVQQRQIQFTIKKQKNPTLPDTIQPDFDLSFVSGAENVRAIF